MAKFLQIGLQMLNEKFSNDLIPESSYRTYDAIDIFQHKE